MANFPCEVGDPTETSQEHNKTLKRAKPYQIDVRKMISKTLQSVDKETNVELEVRRGEYVSSETLTCDQASCELELSDLWFHMQSLIVDNKKFAFQYSPAPENDRHQLTGPPSNNNEVELEHVARITQCAPQLSRAC